MCRSFCIFITGWRHYCTQCTGQCIASRIPQKPYSHKERSKALRRQFCHVAKLAPKRFASLLMGVWFLGNAAGYALAGTLGAIMPPTGDKYTEASAHGINLGAVLNGAVQPTADQLAFLKSSRIATTFPQFAGFAIHNLYEFFMVFVVLCCGAGILLYALTPLLKRMMHGV